MLNRLRPDSERKRPYKLYVHLTGQENDDCFLYGEYSSLRRLSGQMEALLKLGKMITVVVGENLFTKTHSF